MGGLRRIRPVFGWGNGRVDDAQATGRGRVDTAQSRQTLPVRLGEKGQGHGQSGGDRGDRESDPDQTGMPVGIFDSMQPGSGDRLDFPGTLHPPGVVGQDDVKSFGRGSGIELLVLGPGPTIEIEQVDDLMMQNEGRNGLIWSGLETFSSSSSLTRLPRKVITVDVVGEISGTQRRRSRDTRVVVRDPLRRDSIPEQSGDLVIGNAGALDHRHSTAKRRIHRHVRARLQQRRNVPAVAVERLQDIHHLVDDHIGPLPHQVNRLIGGGQIDGATVGDQRVGRQMVTLLQIASERVERPPDPLERGVGTQFDAGSQRHHVTEGVKDRLGAGDLRYQQQFQF